MKGFIFSIIILAINSCLEANTDRRYKSINKDFCINIDLNISYDSLKLQLKNDRITFQRNWFNNKITKDTLIKKSGDYLAKTLTERIFPFWYGTTWDFNGITEKPGEGKIACGYFVSTTLRDAGFKINRYKVAQQHAYSIVKSLCSKYEELVDFDKFKYYMKNQKDGIYILGMQYHVGFLYKKNNEVKFIHSSFLGPGSVVQESIETSEALRVSDVYVVGFFSTENNYLKKWIKGEFITVVQ